VPDCLSPIRPYRVTFIYILTSVTRIVCLFFFFVFLNLPFCFFGNFDEMLIIMLLQYTLWMQLSCAIIIYLYRAIDTSSAEFQGHLGGVYSTL